MGTDRSIMNTTSRIDKDEIKCQIRVSVTKRESVAKYSIQFNSTIFSNQKKVHRWRT